MANQNGYVPYDRRVWERDPGSANWVQRANDGRLVAASVEDRRVNIWYEAVPGGAWIGPVPIWTGDPISPCVILLKRPDGLPQIFALRQPLEQEDFFPATTTPLEDIVTAVQAPGRPFPVGQPKPILFGAWQSAGSPDRLCLGFGCQYVGSPAAAVDGGGWIFVFARNSQGLLSYTVSLSGAACATPGATNCWSSWDSSAFGSADIIEGISAITRDDGRVEVFATLRTGPILGFVQDPDSTRLTAIRGFSSLRAASAPTSAKNHDGRVRIYYREATNPATLVSGARVLTFANGEAAPTVLYGDAGAGPVAALHRESGGQIMLFERNVWDGISETRQGAPNGAFVVDWSILGSMVNEYPAAATDGSGRTVVVVKGPDGYLYMQREVSPAASGDFGPWARIGDAPPPTTLGEIGLPPGFLEP